jgi:DNA-binding response OmpR family regulator
MKTLVSGKSIRALIVESDDVLTAEICTYLERLGYDLSFASTGTQGWQTMASGAFDIMIIDVMLPGMDGLTLCRRLREELANETPVIMLTQSESLENRVLCLNWGADDFLIKPISLLELEARIRAVVRRARAPQRSRVLHWAGLKLDPQFHTAYADNRLIHLRPISFALLARLMRTAPGVVTRQELELEIYGDSPPGSDSLRAHIHILRHDLKKAGKDILRTVSHVGYRLDDACNACV